MRSVRELRQQSDAELITLLRRLEMLEFCYELSPLEVSLVAVLCACRLGPENLSSCRRSGTDKAASSFPPFAHQETYSYCRIFLSSSMRFFFFFLFV
jgi:hypothetical protein